MECGGVISEVNCVPYNNAFNQSADECELMAQFFNSDLSFDAQSFWADHATNANYLEHLFVNPNNPTDSEYDQSYLTDSNDALIGVNVSSYDSSSLDLSLLAQEQNANAYLNLTPIGNEIASGEVNSDLGMNVLKPTTRQKRKFDEFGGNPEKKAPVKRSAKKGKTIKEQQNREEEESNVETTAEEMSSVACNSDDDSNGSGNSGARSKRSSANANNGCKTRAGRGSATDPQSLYARKRRERINERLKTLQNLVPNGTKVDISTMLEEAVQYVKFLQLQIKMLSSDDLWMYAPIAYNGMNIGIDLNI